MIQKSALEVTLRITDPTGNQMNVKAFLLKPLNDARSAFEVTLAEIECIEFDVLRGAAIRCRHGMEFTISFRDGQLIQEFQRQAEGD